MKANIIKIGNSKGLRLSKVILEKYNIKDTVELLFEEDGIKIKSVENPRKDWEVSFQRLHKNGDDKLLIDEFFKDEKQEGWK